MSRLSPWERVLGSEIAELDPPLRRYFGAIPPGSVGRASGTFDTVGTPRRWLWPVLALLAMDGVMFPVWERSVVFSVENRSTEHGSIVARRTFHFDSGDRVMVDEIGVTRNGLVDRLGRLGVVTARLTAEVEDGRLELRSTLAALRLGPVRLSLGPLSPRVTLVERAMGGLQHVSLILDAPWLGRLYEYRGSFTYEIEPDEIRPDGTEHG
ncbi:hypothetical protein IWX81_000596 [Salinibacterium sp. CAN_S4]|uniref:DUF4166 domain-containing protein n=1 Tax=Salinibacterium sp. CAN_S4 TaxID=2787727 RepID=UPI0018F03445